MVCAAIDVFSAKPFAMITIGGKAFGCLAEAIGNARPGDTVSISGAHADEQLIISNVLQGCACLRAP